MPPHPLDYFRLGRPKKDMPPMVLKWALIILGLLFIAFVVLVIGTNWIMNHGPF